MEDTAIPYELPEAENHSFFFIDQRVETRTEAKLHRHDAWELYYVVHGYGSRTAGDTCQPFTAFDHSLVKRCMEAFPEVRNRLAGIPFPTDAMKFGPESSRIIRKLLSEMTGMDELERLSAMLRLLPTVFTSPDHTFAGRPMRIERDVRRMQQIAAYVMAHYVHAISLKEIAAEVGMNRSAFCSYFKRCKGMTFSQFVTQYRLNTACELLKHSQKQVSEICYLVGFNDVPHFNRMFKKAKRMSPKAYRNAESIKSP